MKIKLIQQSNLFKSLKVIEDTVRDDLINFSRFDRLLRDDILFQKR